MLRMLHTGFQILSLYTFHPLLFVAYSLKLLCLTAVCYSSPNSWSYILENAPPPNTQTIRRVLLRPKCFSLLLCNSIIIIGQQSRTKTGSRLSLRFPESCAHRIRVRIALARCVLPSIQKVYKRIFQYILQNILCCAHNKSLCAYFWGGPPSATAAITEVERKSRYGNSQNRNLNNKPKHSLSYVS